MGRAQVRTTEGDGKLSRIAHFRKLAIRRAQPGNCRRCGKPSATPTCDRCREYHRQYKRRLATEKLADVLGVVAVLAQFRRELSRLRATIKTMSNRYRVAYRRGYSAGLAGKRARFRRGAWMPPQMSKQELAEINHAYDHEEDNR